MWLSYTAGRVTVKVNVVTILSRSLVNYSLICVLLHRSLSARVSETHELSGSTFTWKQFSGDSIFNVILIVHCNSQAAGTLRRLNL